MRDPEAIESFWTVEVENMFLVETSPFIIYMNKISGNQMQLLCENNLEQQICLLKVSDSVKEKAMQKLMDILVCSQDINNLAPDL